MEQPTKTRLVLIGGGHAHALGLLELIKREMPNDPLHTHADVYLISEGRFTPYSGMLTGMLAGDYEAREIYLDLEELATRAGVRFIMGRARAIDLEKKQVTVEFGGQIHYDILSLDCGAGPDPRVIPGASEHAHPVKPVQPFQKACEKLFERLRNTPDHPRVRIVLIGAGASGCEVLAALCGRLKRLGYDLEPHLIDQGEGLLQAAPRGARKAFKELLDGYQTKYYFFSDVVEIGSDFVKLKDGRVIISDFTVLTTTPLPAPWIRDLPLKKTAKGYLEISDELLTSDPSVFAVGDVALNPRRPVERAGVFAVRQAPILIANWRAKLTGSGLKPYLPQKAYLTLMIDGLGGAIGYRGRMVFPRSRWVRKWKHYLDSKFMRSFGFK